MPLSLWRLLGANVEQIRAAAVSSPNGEGRPVLKQPCANDAASLENSNEMYPKLQTLSMTDIYADRVWNLSRNMQNAHVLRPPYAKSFFQAGVYQRARGRNSAAEEEEDGPQGESPALGLGRKR